MSLGQAWAKSTTFINVRKLDLTYLNVSHYTVFPQLVKSHVKEWLNSHAFTGRESNKIIINITWFPCSCMWNITFTIISTITSTDINYKHIFFVSRWNIVVWLNEVLALVVQMLGCTINDESLCNENVLGKLTALFSGRKFIQWLALSTFWTIGAWIGVKQ